MTKILVTGGAGFIGSHLVDKLVAQNAETYVLVSGFRSNVHPKMLNKEAVIIRGDLRNDLEVKKATKNMDYVFHLGGVLSHYVDAYPQLAIETNILGTWNLKKACFHNNVGRIFFASSAFIYGEQGAIFEWGQLLESCRPRPKGLYGATKLAAENVLKIVHPFSVPYTILRLFNVYGPRQYPDPKYTSVVSTWILKALKKEPLEIHGDGSQKLDFIYVEDVAEAFIRCLNFYENTENQTYNVGSENAISMERLAAMTNRLTGNPMGAYYNAKHPAYLPYMRACTLKLRNQTNWQPETSLEDGLKKTIEFYRSLI